MHIHFIDSRCESDPEYREGGEKWHIGFHPTILLGQVEAEVFENIFEYVYDTMHDHAKDGSKKGVVHVCVCRQGKHRGEATKNASRDIMQKVGYTVHTSILCSS